MHRHRRQTDRQRQKMWSRLIVKPDVWGPQARIRLSNAFGTKPVTFDGAFVGLQESGAAVVKGTNQPVLFGGQKNVTVQPGQSVVSDAVALPFVAAPASPLLKAASSPSASTSQARAAR
jgi:hypothetical protein